MNILKMFAVIAMLIAIAVWIIVGAESIDKNFAVTFFALVNVMVITFALTAIMN